MLLEDCENGVATDVRHRFGSGNPWEELLLEFDSLTDGIILLNRFKQVVGLNRAAETLIGWTYEELQQSVVFCQLCDGVVSNYNDEGLSTCMNCRIFTENSPYLEMILRHKNGRNIAVTVSSTLLKGTEDRPECTVLVLRDISTQKQRAKENMSRRLSNKMIQTLEEERKRVSKELHDGIGQNLFGIQMTLDMLKDRFKQAEMEADYENLYEMTTQVLEEVRNISTELRPSILDDLGLVPAIRSYIKRVQSSVPFKIVFEYNGNVRLDHHSETALYRIFQEALSNAIKYSKAEHFNVDLYFQKGDDQKVVLTIIDDGKGFSAEEIGDNGTGLGLFGMKERVASLKGTIRIDSDLGVGTRIEVVLPQGGRS